MNSVARLNGVEAIWDGGELEILMSANGLSELMHCVRGFAYGNYLLDKRTQSDDSVENIEICHGEGRLRLTVSGGRAVLLGNEDALTLLASNMAHLSRLWGAGGEQHLHFDPSTNQILLDEESEAFILSPEIQGEQNA